MPTSEDFYQRCHHCSRYVNTYNDHAVVKNGGVKHFLHVDCVQHSNLSFSEDEIQYKNLWCRNEPKKCVPL